jgi:hypothetical protein
MCVPLSALQLSLDDIDKLMQDTAEAREYQVRAQPSRRGQRRFPWHGRAVPHVPSCLRPDPCGRPAALGVDTRGCRRASPPPPGAPASHGRDGALTRHPPRRPTACRSKSRPRWASSCLTWTTTRSSMSWCPLRWTCRRRRTRSCPACPPPGWSSRRRRRQLAATWRTCPPRPPPRCAAWGRLRGSVLRAGPCCWVHLSAGAVVPRLCRRCWLAGCAGCVVSAGCAPACAEGWLRVPGGAARDGRTNAGSAACGKRICDVAVTCVLLAGACLVQVSAAQRVGEEEEEEQPAVEQPMLAA